MLLPRACCASGVRSLAPPSSRKNSTGSPSATHDGDEGRGFNDDDDDDDKVHEDEDDGSGVRDGDGYATQLMTHTTRSVVFLVLAMKLQP